MRTTAIQIGPFHPTTPLTESVHELVRKYRCNSGQDLFADPSDFESKIKPAGSPECTHRGRTRPVKELTDIPSVSDSRNQDS
jgi:hypothetical protein